MKKEYLRTKIDGEIAFSDDKNVDLFHEVLVCESKGIVSVYDKASNKIWPIKFISFDHTEENIRKYIERLEYSEYAPFDSEKYEKKMDYTQKDLQNIIVDNHMYLWNGNDFDGNAKILAGNMLFEVDPKDICFVNHNWKQNIIVKYVLEQEDKFLRIYAISENFTFFGESLQVKMFSTSITFNLETGKTYFYRQHPVGTKTSIANITTYAQEGSHDYNACWFYDHMPQNVKDDALELMKNYFKSKGVDSKFEVKNLEDFIAFNYDPIHPLTINLDYFFKGQFYDSSERFQDNRHEKLCKIIGIKPTPFTQKFFDDNPVKLLIFKQLAEIGYSKEKNLEQILTAICPSYKDSLRHYKPNISYQEDMKWIKYPSMCAFFAGLLNVLDEDKATNFIIDNIENLDFCDDHLITRLSFLYLTGNFSDVIDPIRKYGFSLESEEKIEKICDSVCSTNIEFDIKDEISEYIDGYFFNTITNSDDISNICEEFDISIRSALKLNTKCLCEDNQVILITDGSDTACCLMLLENDTVVKIFTPQFNVDEKTYNLCQKITTVKPIKFAKYLEKKGSEFTFIDDAIEEISFS